MFPINLDSWAWVTLLGVVCLLIIVFRERLSELISRTKTIRMTGKGVEFEFWERVKHVQARVGNIQKTVAGHRDGTASRERRPPIDLPARDLFVESWGILKQTVYDACAARNIALTPATGVTTAITQLQRADLLEPEVADDINTLYQIGKEVSGNKKIIPTTAEAQVYREFVDSYVAWTMLEVISPGVEETGTPDAKPGRVTRVATHFPEPSRGHPTATLAGVGGPVFGMRYPVNTISFKIGANHKNNLLIEHDDYVSQLHASIRYEGGDLVLVDEHSTNGTFLNGQRLSTTTPSMVSAGDRIQIGKSTFEVLRASD